MPPNSERPSFARLPGQEHDDAARVRRREIQESELPSVEDLYRFAFSHEDLGDAERRAESYALASLIIEQFWDYLQKETETRPFSYTETPADLSFEEGDTVAQRFVMTLNRILDERQDRYFKEVQDKIGGEDSEFSKEDAMIVRFLDLQRVEGRNAGLPSMKDLVTLIGRMADVVPKVYVRDLGREPTDSEITASLKHVSLKRFFIELMTNSHSFALAITSTLDVADQKKRLDDYRGSFKPEFFVLDDDQEEQIVRLHPQWIRTIRGALEQIARQRAEEGKVPPRALQCPALYTGKFVEMHDWVVDEFGRFSLSRTDLKK